MEVSHHPPSPSNSMDGHTAEHDKHRKHNARHGRNHVSEQPKSSSKSNITKSQESSKKGKEKKLEKLVTSSPRLVFLKRKVKHIYKDTKADRLGSCGRVTCRSVKVFVGIFSILLFLRGAFRQYFAHVLEHIQTHFTLSMTELEFLIGVEKIGFVLLIIFCGYYGNKMHKPAAIIVGSVLCATGIILCAVPYFLELSREYNNRTDTMMYYEAGLCQIGANVSTTSKTQCETLVFHPNKTQAFSILATGNFAIGIGSALMFTLGFLYVEDTAVKTVAPLYYGVILFMNGLGETIGLVLAWQFTKLPYKLTGTLDLKEWNVGAWWLGMPILAILFIIVSIPLVLFPKWIVEPKWLIKRRNRQLKHWLGLMKTEQKFVEKIRRRQRRKRRKEARAKRRAELAAEGQQVDKATAENTKLNSSRNVHSNLAFDSTEDTGNGHVPSAQVNTTSSNGNTHSNSDANGDIEYRHENDDTETDRADSETAHNDSDDPSEVSSTGQNTPPLQESHDVPMDDEVNPDNIIIEDPEDKQDAAPRRGVRFMLADSEVILEPGMDVDDVLQMEEPPKPKEKTEKSNKEKTRMMLGRRIQDLPKNLWFLMNRPVYMLMLTGTLLAAYSPAGYQATLPGYISSQLPMVSPPGYIVAGIPYTLGLSLGALVAGWIIHKRTWRLTIHVRMILIIQSVVVILFLVAMAPTCSVNYKFIQPLTLNTTRAGEETCSSKCDCRDAQFDPICSPDGVVFPSSCIAGCRRAKVLPEENIMLHDLCLCLPDVVLSSGFCNNGCYGATAGYGVLVFIISLGQSFGQVSLLIVCLRCIAQKLRSLALGFAVCIVLLAAYVPGVAVFRALGKMACNYSHEDCFGDIICWDFHSDKYRYLYHGAIAVFQLVSIVFYLAAYLVIRSKAKAVSKVTDASQLSSVSIDNEVRSTASIGVSNKAEDHDDPAIGADTEL